MLQSEFEERYGSCVTPEYYKEVEEIYSESSLEKDAFVKEFKALEKKETFCALWRLSRFMRNVNKELQAKCKHLEKWYEEAKAKSRAKDIEMGKWLVETAQSTKEERTARVLKTKAVSTMGMKAYLVYMVEKGYLLNEEERKELLCYINGER